MKGQNPVEMETLRAALERCYGGSDPEAWQFLWDWLSRATSSLVIELNVSKEEVADKLKDRLVDLAEIHPTWDPFLDQFPTPNHFRAYLKTIVYRKLVDEIRGTSGGGSQWPTDPARLTEMADTRDDGHTDSGWVDRSSPYMKKFERVLPLLNRQDRFIIRCRLEGLKHKEIAKCGNAEFGTSWTEGSVRIRYYRLLKKIRRLSDELNSSEDSGNE